VLAFVNASLKSDWKVDPVAVRCTSMTTVPERVAAPARLLRACRDVYLAAWDEGLAETREGSAAHIDFGTAEAGPDGPWPDWLAPQTRTMAVTLVRQQADLCVSVGTLMEAGEIFEPIYSLARSAFEFGARAFWLLEPDTTLRERCARGRLMELTSLHHLKDAARYRPDQVAAAGDIASLKTSWKALTNSVRGMFADLDLAESGKWSVEGVRYESWTDVAGRWLERSGASVDGRWLYKHLSVRAHPQGLIATPGLGVGAEGQTIRSVSIEEIGRLAFVLLVPFWLSLSTITSYHGLASGAVAALEGELREHFPSAFA